MGLMQQQQLWKTGTDWISNITRIGKRFTPKKNDTQMILMVDVP
jgi:hypothetical protein